MRSGALRWARVAVIALLLGAACANALVTVLTAAMVVPRIDAVDIIEPVVHGLATRVARGEALYQPLDRAPFTVAAYTPVYYVVAGWLHGVAGSGFLGGRLLSFVSALACGTLAGWIAWRLSRSAWAGVLAATLFLGVGTPAFYPWSALYRVDFLGLAFSLGVIALLVGRPGTREIVLAGVLVAAAFHTKQTFLAAFVAPAIYLVLTRRWRLAVMFSTIAGGLIGGISLWLELSSGAFIANTVFANVNPPDWPDLPAKLFNFVAFQLGCSVAALAYARLWLRDRERSGLRLVLLYWACSLPTVAAIFKLGAIHNYWLELAAATAVLAAVGIHAALNRDPISARHALTYAPIMLLLLNLTAIFQATRDLPMARFEDLRQTWAMADEYAEVARFIGEIEGDVIAEDIGVLSLAGKRIGYEPVIYTIFANAGTWSPDPVIDSICNGSIRWALLSRPVESIHEQRWMFPERLAETVLATAVYDHEWRGRRFYRLDASGCQFGALVS